MCNSKRSKYFKHAAPISHQLQFFLFSIYFIATPSKPKWNDLIYSVQLLSNSLIRELLLRTQYNSTKESYTGHFVEMKPYTDANRIKHKEDSAAKYKYIGARWIDFTLLPTLSEY